MEKKQFDLSLAVQGFHDISVMFSTYLSYFTAIEMATKERDMKKILDECKFARTCIALTKRKIIDLDKKIAEGATVDEVRRILITLLM